MSPNRRDFDRVVLNLTGENEPDLPLTLVRRDDGKVTMILTHADGTEEQVTMHGRQWRVAFAAIRWLTRGDTPWPLAD